MSFNEFCKSHGVSEQERVKIARYLAVIRMEQTLKLQEATNAT